MRSALFILVLLAGFSSLFVLLSAAIIDEAAPGIVLGIAAATFLATALAPSGWLRRLDKGTIGYLDFTAYADGTVVVKHFKGGRVANPSLEFAERIAKEQALAQGASADIPISYQGYGRKP